VADSDGDGYDDVSLMPVAAGGSTSLAEKYGLAAPAGPVTPQQAGSTVYTGQGPGVFSAGRGFPGADKTVPSTSWGSMYYQLTPAEKRKLKSKVRAIIGREPTEQELIENYLEVGSISAGLYDAKIKRTPWDVLNDLAKAAQSENSASGGGAGPTSGTSSSVSLTSQTEAHALLNNALTGALGRRANDADVQDFLAMLNGAEQDNPQETSWTNDPGQEGVGQRQTSTSSGGVDAGQLAENFAEKQPGYDAYQRDSTYMNAFLQAIDSPV